MTIVGEPEIMALMLADRLPVPDVASAAVARGSSKATAVAALLAAGCLLASGCGGDDTSADRVPQGSGAETPTTTGPGDTVQDPPGAAAVDPCALLTDEEVTAAIGGAVSEIAPTDASCEKEADGLGSVIVRHQEPGLGPDSSFDAALADGAEPVEGFDAEALYDSSIELVRMRTDGGHHLSVQLVVAGGSEREPLMELAEKALSRFLSDV